MSLKDWSWNTSKELERVAIDLENAIRSICQDAPNVLWIYTSPSTTVVEHLQHDQIALVGWFTDITEFPKVKRVKAERPKLVHIPKSAPGSPEKEKS